MDPMKILLLSLALITAACAAKPAAPAQVSADTWATIDGRAIMRDTIEKAYRRNAQLSPVPSDEEASTAKLNALNEYIVQEILLAKAVALKITVSDADLDKAFIEAKNGIADETFKKEIAARNLTEADMKESLRRDLLAQKVLDQEVVAKVTITDQEVTDFFNANKAQFNRPEEAFRIAQIVVTPGRDTQVNNRTGDDAVTPEQANAKVQMLMERLKAGASFGDLAADFSEDPQTAQRGGDLGFIPVSALQKQAPLLRDAVLKAQPGTVNHVNLGGGHTLVLVIAHDQAGQKDLSMPEVKTAITNGLKDRREQVMRTAYLSSLRNDTTVINYFAKRLVESQGKMK